MASNNPNINIQVQAQTEAAVQNMLQLKAAAEATAAGYQRLLSQTNSTAAQVIAANTAMVNAAKQYQAAVMANSNAAAAAGIDAASAGMTKFGHSTAGARTELLVLAHELSQGQFNRFGGSLLVLAERMDLLKLALTPVGLAALGVAAALAVVSIQAIKAESAARALETVTDALTGVGQQSSTSQKDIAALINQLSVLPGVSRDAAVETVANLSRIPAFTADMRVRIAEDSVALAKTLGIELPDAAKKLATALLDPAKATDGLAKEMGLLTVAQEEQIKALQRGGNEQQAMVLLLQALEDRVKGAADNYTPLQQSIGRFKQALADQNGTLADKKPWIDFSSFVDFATARIKNGREELQLFLSFVPAFALAQKLFGKTPAAPTAGKQSASGQIKGAAADNYRAEAAAKKAQDAQIAADNLQDKQTLSENAGFKTRQKQADEMLDKRKAEQAVIARNNDLIKSGTLTEEQKADALAKIKLAQEQIAGIDEQVAKKERVRGPDLTSATVTLLEKEAELQNQLAGGTEKMTTAEKALFDLREGKFDKYSQAQRDEYEVAAKRLLITEKQAKILDDDRASAEALAKLQGQYIQNSAKKDNSQEAVISGQVQEALGSNTSDFATRYAQYVKEQAIKAQLVINNAELDRTLIGLNKTTDHELANIDEQNLKSQMTTDELRNYSELQKVRLDYDNELAKLSPNIIGYEEERTRLLNAQADALSKLASKQDERMKLEEDWQAGIVKGVKEVAEDSTKYATIAHDAFKSAFSTISDTLFNFLQTGKFSFADLATSFKKTIDKMVADALAAKLISSLFGSTGAKGTSGIDASSIAGQVIGGLTGLFKASGGPVTAGQAYIVGERRPEVFVPKVNGTILPNTSGLQGGGAAQAVNINISAVDAQSVRGLFVNDKRFIADLVNSTNRAYNLR